ncbi:hypothetical protein [Polyangium sp. y55x31]|uniref:hypothetical protein n=1 Tax=Polyangium sp. y55x31 TaxID=3042688 RepID=UPI0024823286|nr:hypothetical protein [Polyangium sp. y55x31]MDI1484844.1 hypothetical protein [Polyangium sp. y55x31]
MAGRFRILRERLAFLLRGHEISIERANANANRNETALKEAPNPSQEWPSEDKGDVLAHVLARFSFHPQGAVSLDHWRKPARFEDNTWLVAPYVYTYFPQIPSVQNARRDPECMEQLRERIKVLLSTLDARRTRKMQECAKLNIEYKVDELAGEIAYEILSHECRVSGMKETQISRWFGFYLKPKRS